MAIRPIDRYPSQTDGTDPAYPHGKAKNVNSPGDNTGTPWEKDLVNDWLGFQQAALVAAGITPSGTPDTSAASQLLAALTRVKAEVFTGNGTWTKPAGASRVMVVAIGGGCGGGGKNGGVRGGGGGASGARRVAWFNAASLGATVAVTVGTGGALNSVGTSSSFGSHLVAESLGKGGRAFLNGTAPSGDGGGGGGMFDGEDGLSSAGGFGGASSNQTDTFRDFISIGTQCGASRRGFGGGGNGNSGGSPGFPGIHGDVSNGGGGGGWSGGAGRGGGERGGLSVPGQNGNCGGGWGGGGGGEAGASGSGGGGGGGWADIPGWPASAQQTSGQPGAVMVITYFA